MNITRRRAAGFTLIEIMLTVVLTAVVVGMGFGLLTSAQQIAQLQQEQSASGRDGWTFLYRLTRELREATPPSQLGEGAEWRGASGSAKLLDMVSTAGWPDVSIKDFEGRQLTVSKDTIRFCTLRVVSPSQPPAPGMIEYSLERDPKKNVVHIVRRAALLGASPDQVETTVIEPSDPASSVGFVSLGFQYLDAQSQWRPEWTDAKTMPRAVRISVSTLVRPSRQIKLPVMNQYSTLVYLPTGSRIPQ
ncbi:MAG: prepilin-type N-terminal cleavage/methylation domain-containing protein [Candidatus Brocadiia bacterium]|jgi:hypothetical protein